MLFGKDELASARIEHILNLPYLCSSYGCGWYGFNGGIMHLIVLPLLSALFFIFVYPVPARFAYAYSKKEQEKIITLKNKIEKKSIVPQEKYDKLILRLNDKERETVNLLESKDETISALERDNNALKERIVHSDQESKLNKAFQVVAEKDKNPIDSSLNNLPGISPKNTNDELMVKQQTWRNEYSHCFEKGVLNDFDVFLSSLYAPGPLKTELLGKYHGLELIDFDEHNKSWRLNEKGKFFSNLHFAQ